MAFVLFKIKTRLTYNLVLVNWESKYEDVCHGCAGSETNTLHYPSGPDRRKEIPPAGTVNGIYNLLSLLRDSEGKEVKPELHRTQFANFRLVKRLELYIEVTRITPIISNFLWGLVSNNRSKDLF